MDTKYKIIAAVVVVTGAFATGRWAAPTKVVTVTQTVEVEKKHEDVAVDTNKNVHKETKTTEVVKPDGTKETTTDVTEDTKAISHEGDKTDTDSSRTEVSSKEVTRDSSKVTISVLGGAKVFGGSEGLNPPVYGGSISKPIFGPATVGIWGLSNGTVGCSVGLTF
jgi:hypothetical protein